MKKGKVFLSAAAFLTAIAGVFAFKAHHASLLGSLYTFSSSRDPQYLQIPCTIDQSQSQNGSCTATGTLYTFSSTSGNHYTAYTGSAWLTIGE